MVWRWIQRAGSVANLIRLLLFVWIVVGPSAVILALSEAWDYLSHANLAFKFLVGLGVFAVFGPAFGAIAYFLLTPAPNYSGPRWWRWRQLPLQKISWDFQSPFSSQTRGNEPVKFLLFHPQFRINWGDGIKPHRCYLDFRAKGLQIPVRIEQGNSFLRTERIPFIERDKFMWRNKWTNCSAVFRSQKDDDSDAPYEPNDQDALTAGEFFERFGPFDFVFEYDDKIFRKRFKRRRLAGMLRSMIARHGEWAQ